MTIEEAWASLQGTPSYVERYANAAPVPVIAYEEGDELLHTDEKPFCADLSCFCHYQAEYHLAVAGVPLIGRL